jgi:hypothetical protein
MKTIVLGIFLSFSYQYFAQSVVNENIANDNDSTIKNIYKLSEDYAKIMETWSPEKKKKFSETFVYTRGGFRIPNEPIKLND